MNKEDRQTISGVFDFNSVRLMNYIKQLNSDLLKDDPSHTYKNKIAGAASDRVYYK